MSSRRWGFPKPHLICAADGSDSHPNGWFLGGLHVPPGSDVQTHSICVRVAELSAGHPTSCRLVRQPAICPSPAAGAAQ